MDANGLIPEMLKQFNPTNVIKAAMVFLSAIFIYLYNKISSSEKLSFCALDKLNGSPGGLYPSGDGNQGESSEPNV